MVSNYQPLLIFTSMKIQLQVAAHQLNTKKKGMLDSSGFQTGILEENPGMAGNALFLPRCSTLGHNNRINDVESPFKSNHSHSGERFLSVG